jgi:hypothetical protein
VYAAKEPIVYFKFALQRGSIGRKDAMGPGWPLALGRVFCHLLERARRHTHRKQASFLHNASLGCPISLVAMHSQLSDQPFGMPLSIPQYKTHSAGPAIVVESVLR